MIKIKFEKTDDIIDICRDNVFKTVFTKATPESEEALSGFLSKFTELKLSIIMVIANELPIDNIRDRQIRFDINCKTESGELINVEMTMYPDDSEPVRLEFYAGKLFTGQDIRGKEKTFSDLKPTYQISILVKKSFFADEDIVHCFEYYDPERQVSLGGRSRIITVELNKLDKIIEKPVEQMTAQERWAVFFRYVTDTEKRGKINQILEIEEDIAMACQVLRNISKDETERARLMSEYKFETDYQSKIVQAERRGEKRGEERGEKRGEKKGENRILELLESGKAPEEILKLYGKNI
jgi:predicted transposase/invertase (TIGR01784 family)